MREIKFRAWIDSDRQMYEVLQFSEMFPDEGFYRVFIKKQWREGQPMNYRISGNNALMQFTGMKDKDGKEIYESDLVRKDSYSIGYCEPIVWRDCMFQIGNTGICPLYDANGYEVIGNIYENHELLKL